MKKTTLFLFFFSLLIHSGIIYSQFEPFYDRKNSANVLLLLNLKGKVRSVEQVSYKAIDNGGVITKGVKENNSQGCVNGDFLMQFDASGRETKETYYDEMKIMMVLNHKFNDALKIEDIEKTEETNKVVYEYTYKYNAKGKVLELKTTQNCSDNTSYNNKSVFKYDTSDKLIETNIYVNGGAKSQGKTLFTYDSRGVLSERQAYNEDGKPWFKYTFKYDDKGNQLEENAWTLDNRKIDKTFVYKYDSNNNVIQKDLFQPAGKLSKSFTYKYEYDKTGNWIKRTDFIDNKVTYILERQLVYY